LARQLVPFREIYIAVVISRQVIGFQTNSISMAHFMGLAVNTLTNKRAHKTLLIRAY